MTLLEKIALIARLPSWFWMGLIACIGLEGTTRAADIDDIMRELKRAEKSVERLQKNMQSNPQSTGDKLERTAREDNLVLDPQILIKRMPKEFTGWMKWRDRDTRILMTMNIEERFFSDGWVNFQGPLEYYSEHSGTRSFAYGFLYIDPISASMRLVEVGAPNQTNFDDQGQFLGFVDIGSLKMSGTWSKSGLNRIADFQLNPKTN